MIEVPRLFIHFVKKEYEEYFKQNKKYPDGVSSLEALEKIEIDTNVDLIGIKKEILFHQDENTAITYTQDDEVWFTVGDRICIGTLKELSLLNEYYILKHFGNEGVKYEPNN